MTNQYSPIRMTTTSVIDRLFQGNYAILGTNLGETGPKLDSRDISLMYVCKCIYIAHLSNDAESTMVLVKKNVWITGRTTV